MLREKYLKFAAAYAVHGNGTKAAIEAGFAPKSAAVTASKLIRRAKIQDLIRARDVNRSVHAQETYRNLIDLGRAAMAQLGKTWGDASSSLAERVKILDAAGRALERLGRVEGLLLPEPAGGDGRTLVLNLQQLVQIFNTNYADAGKPAGAMLEAAKEGGGLSSPPIPAEWKSIDESGGNGHAKGNGDQSAAKPPDAA